MTMGEGEGKGRDEEGRRESRLQIGVMFLSPLRL